MQINFLEASEQELKQFAEKLIATINTERSFTDETKLLLSNEPDAIEVGDLDGNLYIGIVHEEDTIDVEREAFWTAPDRESADEPEDSDIEYRERLETDARKAFKTLFVELEGYKVTLVIQDAEEVELVDAHIDTCTDEDAGYGRTEFWGVIDYDSRPYVECEGTLTVACDIYGMYLMVEPIDAQPEVEEAEEV